MEIPATRTERLKMLENLTPNQLTKRCDRCDRSEWKTSVVENKRVRILGCQLKNGRITECDGRCEMFKPSPVLQDYFSGATKSDEVKILKQILYLRICQGRL